MLKDKLENAKPTQFFDDDIVEWWKEKISTEKVEQSEEA